MSNTSQCVYFVSYTHACGSGMITVPTASQITTWDDITNVAAVIDRRIGMPVAIVNFQLLSGPARPASTHLAAAYERLHLAVSHSNAHLASDHLSGSALKGLLRLQTDELEAARDTIARLLADRT